MFFKRLNGKYQFTKERKYISVAQAVKRSFSKILKNIWTSYLNLRIDRKLFKRENYYER